MTLRFVPLLLASLTLGACAYEPMGPASTGAYPPPPPPPPPPRVGGNPNSFQASDFAWSTQRGGGAIRGALGYRANGERFTCQGGDVILTPETQWSRRRMVILYGSATAATVPLSIVRARTPGAPVGDYARFVRKATCDGANRFVFDGVPDGGWFVITIARPASGQGESVALMRRVEMRGEPRTITLY